ncbi:MAG: hypothetical protein ACFFD7_05785 [Candidatus Thorarchaeota archaeon]
MNKKEKFYNELGELLRDYLDKKEKQLVVNYLVKNSNLPGRRANIELAKAFAEISQDYEENLSKKLWELSEFLISFTVDTAPTNDPKEFLVFCGTWAIAAIGARNPEYFRDSLIILKELSKDSRWRVREAVAFGLQELLITHQNIVLTELQNWINDRNWLTLRAIAAGISHPSVLKDNITIETALEIHRAIFSKILSNINFSSEEFKILKKGLSYTLSVVIYANPENGFKFLSEYANTKNIHIQMIIKENLKKNRLTKNFPKEILSIKKKLEFSL